MPRYYYLGVMKLNKKITSVLLAVCLLLSCVAAGSFTATGAAAAAADVSAKVDGGVSAKADDGVSANYGLAKNIQDGQILQAWNWSYSGIKSNMKKIAEQGFTAVQTTPIQTIKESTKGKTMQGSWWVYYQPSNFKIDTNSWNALGTKSEFKDMCDEAHKYGVKVVVDAVLNHMANKGDNTLSDTIPGDIRNDGNCWHSVTQNTQNWGSRWDITHNCMGGLPDLNTGNSKIQNYEIAFMKECIDCGVDGFRFDGAKHIEVPNDYENAGSNFWNNLLNTTTSYAKSTRGITPYYYGEILDSTGGGQGIVNQYTKFMSVTCNSVSNDIRNKVNSGDANGAKRTDFSYDDGSAPAAKKAVLWNESHDTYADNKSRGQSDTTMKKTWAIVGSRGEAQGMYLARPRNYNDSIGTAGVTAWGDKEVAAVNHFKNYFVGQSEYLSASGSIVYNERGNSGVVLVNVSGSSASVNVRANKMSNGTYKDEITGNTFTVSGGTIRGQIGSTGIAVVYNPKPAGPVASVTPGSSNYKTDSVTLTLNYENASSGQYSVDNGAFQSYTNGQKITIGAGKDFGTVTTVKVKASNSTETSDVETYTYTKVDPSAVQQIWFDTSQYRWSNVYAYIYADETKQVSAWPGVQMQTDSSTGYRYIDVPEGYENAKVIFTESETATNNRYPADMEPGMDLGGQTVIFRNNKFEPYNPGTVKPTVKPTQPVTQPTTAKPTVPTNPTTPSVRVLIGDVNQDGAITIKDATQIQMHIADIRELTGNGKAAADVTADGYVTIKDATSIQQYLAQNFNKSGNCGNYSGQTPTTPTSATTPTSGSADTSKVYFMNTYGWSPVKAYFWSDDNLQMMSWPGSDMQSEGGNLYSASIPAGANHVIFTKGDDSGKTPDLDLQAGKMYRNGSWTDVQSTQTPTQGGQQSGKVYFRNDANWSPVKAYFWSDDNLQMMSWPGNDMQSEGGNVYSADIPAGANHVIFTKGDDSGKTPDLDLQAGRMYASGSWTDYSGSGNVNPNPGGSYDSTKVYFKNNANWSPVKAYFWSDDNLQMMSWPGSDMQSEGNGVFSAVIPSGANHVIFTKGDDSGKTADLDVHAGQIYDNGSWHS